MGGWATFEHIIANVITVITLITVCNHNFHGMDILGLETYGSGLYWVPPRNPCLSGTVEMTDPSCNVLTEEQTDVLSVLSVLSLLSAVVLFNDDILRNDVKLSKPTCLSNSYSSPLPTTEDLITPLRDT